MNRIYIKVIFNFCSHIISFSSSCRVLLLLLQLVLLLCVFSLVLAYIQNLSLPHPSSDQLHQASVCVPVRSGLQKKNSGGDQAKSPVWRGVASGDVHENAHKVIHTHRETSAHTAQELKGDSINAVHTDQGQFKTMSKSQMHLFVCVCVYVQLNVCLFVPDHDIPRGDVHQQVGSHLIQGWYVFSPLHALGIMKLDGRLPCLCVCVCARVCVTLLQWIFYWEHTCIYLL